MGINFPSSPVDGQVFNASPGVSFVARSGRWRPAPLKTALPKNYIVNPSMQISQENGGANGTTNGFFVVDQWMCAFQGFASVDQARVVVTTQVLLYPFHLSFVAPTRASLGVGDYVMWQQGIEGQRMSDLQWGTAAAKSIVLRFTCNCAPAGNYSAVLRNLPVTRSYVASFAATGGEQEFVIAIPGCTDGTWANNNTAGLYINFCAAAGATFQAPAANAWQTGNYLGYPGMTNIAAAGAGTFNIGRVGLYLDPYMTGAAPPFVIPVWSDERRRCQRYWYKGFGFGGIVTSATIGARAGMRHPAPMRTTPVGSIKGSPRLYDGGGTPIVTALGTACNLYAAEFDITAAAGGLTAGRAAQMYYQGDDNSYIAMDARL